MELFTNHIVSLVVFGPALLALGLLFLPDKTPQQKHIVKSAALGISLLVFFISCFLYAWFDASQPGFQFVENRGWIEAFGISYSLGVDGISLVLILLTTFLTPIALLGSWNAIEEKLKTYLFLILVLETGMLGAFVALDIILFYVFWEAMLIPMYLLIGVWGGKDRIYASMKFFVYTLVGSLLMLVAIFYLMSMHKMQLGNYSAALLDLYRVKVPFDGLWSAQTLLFLAFALAFAIKVPLFPLHTWLPDAHVQAPTAGSVILAGVLLKLGGYGFIRFAFPLFPQAMQFVAPVFMCLGVVAIVYGAWVAMVQPDIKKLVAYSSVSHMGFVILGLFSLNSLAVSGSVYQMLNHGISTGGLFLIVGMLYERRHTREIEEFGGITRIMPIFAVIFMIVTLSSIALPGTNGFVGEFLILMGAYQTNKVLAVVAGTGVIFGAVYMLWMFQRVMFGPVKNNENKHLKDLSLREICVMAPIIAAIFIMGIFPNIFLSKMDASIKAFLSQVKV
ncbi:MAG: NADH-quinone oxidoreductase subunit M [Bdellovibrionota bacterium]